MARWNFEGYSLVEWVKRNKDNLKLLIAALAGFAAPLDVKYQVVVGVVSKLVLDGIDYFASK